MAEAVLVANKIDLDCNIALKPSNAMHPLVQEYMASKGSSLEITDKGRVRLRSDNSEHDVFNGFAAFLQQHGIDTTNPDALNVAPIISIPQPVDPKVRIQRDAIKDLRAALAEKDWGDAQPVREVPVEPVVAKEVPAEITHESAKGSGSKTDKLKAGMFTLFTIFKEAAALVNITAISTVRRAMYNFYLNSINPFINFAFGEIGNEDGYSMAKQTEHTMAVQQPKQSLVIEAPNSAGPNKALSGVLFSRGGSAAKNGATTMGSFANRILVGHQQAAIAKTNAAKLKAQQHNTPKPRAG